jgi:hypothetical protein
LPIFKRPIWLAAPPRVLSPQAHLDRIAVYLVRRQVAVIVANGLPRSETTVHRICPSLPLAPSR